jgi:methyl-accepting chemotaxis protein
MTTQIASAAEEQSAVAEEINRNIVNIGHVVDQASSGMKETAGASDELNRLAEQLQAVVMRFKLPA